MSDYDGILLEDMNGKLDTLLEGQQAMAPTLERIHRIDSRLSNVESDVKVIKAVVKDEAKDHKRLAKRVTRLEQARAQSS